MTDSQSVPAAPTVLRARRLGQRRKVSGRQCHIAIGVGCPLLEVLVKPACIQTAALVGRCTGAAAASAKPGPTAAKPANWHLAATWLNPMRIIERRVA
jgi:hypothetical protein